MFSNCPGEINLWHLFGATKDNNNFRGNIVFACTHWKSKNVSCRWLWGPAALLPVVILLPTKADCNHGLLMLTPAHTANSLRLKSPALLQETSAVHIGINILMRPHLPITRRFMGRRGDDVMQSLSSGEKTPAHCLNTTGIHYSNTTVTSVQASIRQWSKGSDTCDMYIYAYMCVSVYLYI